MKKSTKIWSFIIGIIIQSVGLSLMIRSQLGTGPWDGFYVGITNQFGLTVGIWLIVIGFLLILLNAYLAERRPNFLSLLTIILLGLCIDLCLFFLTIEPERSSYQVLTFLMGLLLASIGMSFYVLGRIAITPADELMYVLSERFQVSLMAAKILTDLCALCLAIILKGPIGLGTILYTCLCGPLLQFFIPRVEQLLCQKTPLK
jgi:uncharacterized membrane protein YczE